MIVRAPRPESGFLIVRNEIARDERLSYRARGVLLDILSRPDNWSTSAERMVIADGTEKRDALLTAFRELRQAGYMITTKTRDDKGHHRSQTYVYDMPREGGEDFIGPLPGWADPTSAPTRGDGSHWAEPGLDGPGLDEPTSKEEPPKKTKNTTSADAEETGQPNLFLVGASVPREERKSSWPVDAADCEEFMAFWRPWVNKAGGRKVAYEKWKVAARKVSPERLVECGVMAREQWARERRTPDRTPHAQTWLYQERWSVFDEIEADLVPAGNESPWDIR